MTGGLTFMQSRTLTFIKRYIEKNGFSPTYDEIKDHLGLGSKSGVNRLVTGLEQRGRVKKMTGRARGIEIIDHDADFHLRQILEAVQRDGSIDGHDPIIADARTAMEGRP